MINSTLKFSNLCLFSLTVIFNFGLRDPNRSMMNQQQSWNVKFNNQIDRILKFKIRTNNKVNKNIQYKWQQVIDRHIEMSSGAELKRVGSWSKYKGVLKQNNLVGGHSKINFCLLAFGNESKNSCTKNKTFFSLYFYIYFNFGFVFLGPIK